MLKRNDSLVSTKCCYLNRNNIEWIVVHGTGCFAPAKNFVDNIRFERVAGSAHDFVDDTSWYLAINHKHGAWAVGDDNGYGVYPNGITNYNSLNIEMVASPYTLPSLKTRQNTAEIVAYYMKMYNIPLSRVVRHYEASYKPCPYGMHGSNNKEWSDFKEMVKEAYKPKYISRKGYLNVKPFMNTWPVFKDDKYWETWNRLTLLNCKEGLSFKILENPRYAVYKVESFNGIGWCYAEDNGNTTVTNVPAYKVSEQPEQEVLYDVYVNGEKKLIRCLGKWIPNEVEKYLKDESNKVVIEMCK